MTMPHIRKSPKSTGRPHAGWVCALALLALPNCAQVIGIEPWGSPVSTLIFCDIPKPPPEGRHCASPEEIVAAIGNAEAAAVALTTGQTTTITLDQSQAALDACGGQPQAIVYHSPFPQGQPGCTDMNNFLTPAVFCIAQCMALNSGDAAFCTANAKVSTNVPLGTPPGYATPAGFPDGCNGEGAIRADFDDPRKYPEPIVWTDQNGTTDSGGSLTRTAATTAPPDFNAGAASTQWFNHGDGYVEFSAAETNKSHVAGLSQIDGGCPSPCPDSDPSLADIHFGISLNVDGRFYILEGGSLVPGPDLNGSWGTYNADERFRVSLKQSPNDPSIATVTYSRLTAPCIPGNPCSEVVISVHADAGHYPLRVDTSFREQDATLSDVRVVRIK